MSLTAFAQTFCLLAPILILLTAGVVITLRSGPARDGIHGWRAFSLNFWTMLAELAAYLVGLVALQEFIGFRIGW